MDSLICSSVFFFVFLAHLHISSSSESIDELFYEGFNGKPDADLYKDGATVIKPSGALRLTSSSVQHSVGHAFYPQPFNMFSDDSSNASSFTTQFVFAIVSPKGQRGGHGLAFTIAPSKFIQGESGHYLGIFNSSNDKASNHIFAVEFDTINGFNKTSDLESNHVGVNINSADSVAQKPASYYTDGTEKAEDVYFENGGLVQAWIEYYGAEKILNVTIAPANLSKPIKPLLSYRSDLSEIFVESMYIGFSSSTGDKASSHYISGWSFKMDGVARELNISNIPIPPEEKASVAYQPQVIALISALVAVVFLLIVWVSLVLYRKRRYDHEVLEDWELDCPRRFHYKDLYLATKGFKASEIIGSGGFGEVYKGTLPHSGVEVAVKKITRNSIQGLREFAAEVESLGRLRHKNLVNLQGWCKRKNDLLLVYDYIPNGSLDSLLYHRPNNNGVQLSWNEKFKILKGVAAGLQYLHEDWEQVVIHRDIKSSNVLIDADLNPRVSDFGLARLYDHGKKSHTTNVVGTVGYIAPEMAQTGKASTKSDVYAYGVLLVEVGSGRRPIDPDDQPEHMILVDWLAECLQSGRMMEVIDPDMNSDYPLEEMELVLKLGLLCSHPRADARPSMKQVMRYLHGEDKLPEVGEWRSSRVDSMNAKFLEFISIDTSFSSSSTAKLSSNSIKNGR